MLGADGFKTTFTLFFLLSSLSFFSLFFSFFFSLLPTLFPLGRGHFASLARGQPSPFAFVILANAGIHSWFSFYAFPCHSVANASVFYFLFIDVGVFEDRAVAMGKPHCNRSICTFRLWNIRFCYPVPELVEGSNLPRAFVILANAGKMNAALKPRRGEIR